MPLPLIPIWIGIKTFAKGISLKAWLMIALIGSLVGYHLYKVSQAKTEVRAELKEENDIAVRDAVIKELAQHIKTQSILTDLGVQEKISFDQDLAAIRRDVSSLKAEYRKNVQTDPIDPVCYLTSWRVQAVNRALGHEE